MQCLCVISPESLGFAGPGVCRRALVSCGEAAWVSVRRGAHAPAAAALIVGHSLLCAPFGPLTGLVGTAP